MTPPKPDQPNPKITLPIPKYTIKTQEGLSRSSKPRDEKDRSAPNEDSLPVQEGQRNVDEPELVQQLPGGMAMDPQLANVQNLETGYNFQYEMRDGEAQLPPVNLEPELENGGEGGGGDEGGPLAPPTAPEPQDE